ncbi:hypothetical protein [Halalkalicoccus salilacus]|uniref:hypothetical protein n=1 Tax=Halalkalicoccus sp. GCM10025704 TaxID=3252662 RepID=UPI0036217789
MAAIIESILPAEEFALQETLSTHPEAQIEIKWVVADDPDQITLYVWVHADDLPKLSGSTLHLPTLLASSYLTSRV